MAGLGDMKGLGASLHDGKKKADPAADGSDDEDPDVRPNTCVSE